MLPSTDVHEVIPLPLGVEKDGADFAVKIESDNMEPLLCNGDILLVKSKHQPKHGEFEIFLMGDGVMHLKRCFKHGGEYRLESLDSTVPDTIVNDYKALNCIGKVVKVLHPIEYKIEDI